MTAAGRCRVNAAASAAGSRMSPCTSGPQRTKSACPRERSSKATGMSPSAASALPGPAGDKDALAHIRFLARGCLTKPVQPLEGARVTQRRASGSLRRDEGGRFRGGAVASVLGLGLMMKAAVSEGAAQPFMKEEKEQGDLNSFRGEAIGIGGNV